LTLASLEAVAGLHDLDALIRTLKQERQLERQHHREREARFLAERDSRKARVADVQAAKVEAEAQAEALRERYEANETRLRELEAKLSESTGDLGELFETVRQVATDVRAQLNDSMVTVQFPQRAKMLDGLSRAEQLPSIDQLEGLWLGMLEEMNQTGRVVRFEAPVISPGGDEAQRSVLRVGPFTAVSGGSYLRYLPDAGRFVELSRQPPLRHLRLAAELEQAEHGVHPLALDPSRGALLGLMVQSPNLLERLRQGGVVGYIIIGLGVLALLLVLERYLVLAWVQRKMRRQSGDVDARSNNPLGRLSLLAQEHSRASLDALDMYLDEAVTREASRLSRGLPTLAIVAAVAPLLGLLGTVTGMIETFQAITLFGAGDPKMMSSGISQALVTTQLGLAVAIPILLLHSFLKGRANNLIQELDRHGTTLLGESVTGQ
jgi:biopolymer transport protein ExbB